MKVLAGLLIANAIGFSLGTDVSLHERSCTYTEYSTSCNTAGTDGNRVISEAQFNYMVVELVSTNDGSDTTGICFTATNMSCGDDDQYTCTTRSLMQSEISTALGACAVDHIRTAFTNLYSECGGAGGIRSVEIGGEGGNVVDYTLYALSESVDACPSDYLRASVACDGQCVNNDSTI
ncbi:uncharacterized protein N7503_003256 [Penicillium pulvis]|uniref:uncharacterized protein n=1 Tax=Penicillium pulvis TaxID=1562058 RepID=UPI002548F789|nr:uncharacterized protein N7503_003256 [Penicillium pulvis]KAJ5805654.1 hypothetical protein N7503_003256 [Penicillium pulvis]